MVKCAFCGKDERIHKGINYITNKGEVKYFCSNKCKTNSLKLKRDKRKIRWTEAFHVTREKGRARLAAANEKVPVKKVETVEKKISVKK